MHVQSHTNLARARAHTHYNACKHQYARLSQGQGWSGRVGAVWISWVYLN